MRSMMAAPRDGPFPVLRTLGDRRATQPLRRPSPFRGVAELVVRRAHPSLKSTRGHVLEVLPTPTNPANTPPANANRSVSVATAPTHCSVANPADAEAAAIVAGRRIPVAIARFPAGCSLGTRKGEKRCGDHEGGGYWS